MKNTTEEFWKMVHDKDVAVIVMLSEFYEDEKVVLDIYVHSMHASMESCSITFCYRLITCMTMWYR